MESCIHGHQEATESKAEIMIINCPKCGDQWALLDDTLITDHLCPKCRGDQSIATMITGNVLEGLTMAPIAKWVISHAGGTKVSGYCKKCQMNWAALASQDDQYLGETYYFCALCSNDMDLEDVHPDEPQYIGGIITPIIDVKTRERFHRKPIDWVPPPPSRRKVWDETWEEFKERELAAQDNHLAQYQSLYYKMDRNHQAAAAATPPMEIVERRFHWE